MLLIAPAHVAQFPRLGAGCYSARLFMASRQKSGESLLTLGNEHVGMETTRAAWNADETRLLSWSWDGTIRVWEPGE